MLLLTRRLSTLGMLAESWWSQGLSWPLDSVSSTSMSHTDMRVQEWVEFFFSKNDGYRLRSIESHLKQLFCL